MRSTLPAKTAGLAAGTLILAACGGAPPGPPSPAPPLDLAGVVDSVLAAPPLHRAQWGVEVRDLATGRVLAARNPETLFSTASNAKIAVVVAALDLLGPGHRFRTTLRALAGEAGAAPALVVEGTGDPSLSASFHSDPLAPLDSLADSLAAAGVHRVDGPLVVDMSAFGRPLVHPAWSVFDVDWYYAAPVAPFAVLEGAIPLVVTPGAVGDTARVDLLLPDGLVGVDAAIRTVPGDDDWDDELLRVAGADSLVLRGSIGAESGPDTSWIAQDDPGRLAGRALARALERRGVRVAGPVVVSYGSDALDAWRAAPATTVAWESPPLAAIAPLSLGESDNWVTEMILRALGAALGGDGGWSASTARVESHLVEATGIDSGAVYLRDGSGLTRQTLMTPAALVSLLRYARTRPWWPAFRDALAQPGEPDSTLEERLLHAAGRVSAKTGTLTHVLSLSGYVVADDGRELVFSILSNASGQPSRHARDAVDRMVEAMIRSGS